MVMYNIENLDEHEDMPKIKNNKNVCKIKILYSLSERNLGARDIDLGLLKHICNMI